MPLYAKSFFHLRPTYELIASKVLFALGHSAATVGIPLYFLKLGLSDAQIGIVVGSISLLMVVLSLYLPPLLEKFNQLNLLVLSAFLSCAAFVLFGFSESIVLSAFLLAIGQAFLHVNSSAVAVLFKDSTRTEREFTKDTGFLGSFTNLGWFVGPLLGGLTLSVAGFKGLFILVGSLLAVGGVYVLIFPFKTVVKERVQIDKKVKANIKFYLSRPQLRIAYLEKLGVDIWWGLVFTFIPIFMLKGGYSEAAIGLYIALISLPLFLFEYKTVRFVAKYGFKRIFLFAYASLALISLLSFFFLSTHLALVLGLILLGSLALSFLEPISDLFFFKKVTLLEEEKTYPIYVTSSPLGNVVSRMLSGVFLVVFFDGVVFILMAVLMSFIVLRSFAVED